MINLLTALSILGNHDSYDKFRTIVYNSRQLVIEKQEDRIFFCNMIGQKNIDSLNFYLSLETLISKKIPLREKGIYTKEKYISYCLYNQYDINESSHELFVNNLLSDGKKYNVSVIAQFGKIDSPIFGKVIKKGYLT